MEVGGNTCYLPPMSLGPHGPGGPPRWLLDKLADEQGATRRFGAAQDQCGMELHNVSSSQLASLP